MKTFHIHIEGIVQGVGFRPFVYKTARTENIKGWVNNTSDGVHIEINADKKTAEYFLQTLINKPPPLAIITNYNIKEINNNQLHVYDDFKIINSDCKTKPKLLLTPDVAICDDCKRELYLCDDRRYAYPFITCTNCGPRYSIIKKLPYDRANTTMLNFDMCKICLKEYHNPLERRHFSQTNSCPNCKIEMQLFENGKFIENFTDIDYIVEKWNDGKIIALKGIGGYLLTCDATNANAVGVLRKRKNRPQKPFALMYPNIKIVETDSVLNDYEKKELKSIHAPIVLLQTRNETELISNLTLEVINNRLARIGVMLPYTPLYELLLHKFNKPIVATSANISDAAIIFQDDKAIEILSKTADIILLNNREILIPQDDGVVQFSRKHKQKITLRRSRGKAPVYINQNLNLPKNTVFAAGAMMKSVFVLLNQKNIYVSQYLGNTENYDAQTNYEKTFNHFKNILDTEINTVIVDKHLDYFSTRFAKKIANKDNAKIITLQHHKAHFYSVLGENNLLYSKDKIMGVIWDGIGLGDDGNIWGGEFFIYKDATIKRVHSIDKFDYILGDKMSKEPRISAISITHNIEEADKHIKKKFSDTELKIYRKLLSKQNNLKSTSMGRFFDAVSSIILDYNINTYEAEASSQLENTASEYYYCNKMTLANSYIKGDKLPNNFVKYIIKKIIIDIEKNIEKKQIAAKFHISLVDYIIRISNKFNIKKIAFSGGVFQNALLTDIIIDFMNKKYELFFQNEFSPNDEGIPFGQLMYYSMNLRS